MKAVRVETFGSTSKKEEAVLYTLTNENGMSASITNYGAALVKLNVPDKEGKLRDLVLGYDDVTGYEKGGGSFGAPVGRNANRIGGAVITIQDKTYELEKNDNGNNLHSGTNYYNKRIWNVGEKTDSKIEFVLHSPDGDQGYPGTLDMHVTYELTEDNELRLIYDAVPDQDTIINMTNHSYFNLDGHDSGNVLKELVTLDADYFTRADAQSIPTGELVDVTGTPMDFRMPRALGEAIDADYEAVRLGKGYDHNWVLKNNGKFDKVAQAVSEKSGIVMEVWTDLPGMQMYTANFLDNEHGKNGAVYGIRDAVCFETQYFPDAVHHENFASPICKKGIPYHTVTSYKFETK
ncbi:MULTISPECIES: aldose epimerase family protein [Clostridia]|uniref:aldose epimerase family protein n=1 Tax=Clostridia TaxID=186801 RepID=UPI000E4B58FA|nr:MULTISPECIES: aldose epimerase family protein [Clostridia]RHV08542.1 galactose mutarotase [Firmicutes bacterium OM07-11]RKQ31043.1 galactose-1-epimerase [Ruminococcus sp. B05]TAP34668.1 galactose mutarotase [Mediterraneibacter sp. gm002]